MPEQLKKILLAFGVTAISLVLGLLTIKIFAPQLLSAKTAVPADIRLIQLDEKAPPFYELVFNFDDVDASPEYQGHKLYLRDPRLIIRPMPLLEPLGYKGPHDVLGFRNFCVPNRFDVMTMGDSQTYGSNAEIRNTWPSQIESLLAESATHPKVYNVSLGGWAAVHYYYLFDKMLTFEPKVVIIAHYMGNDSLECFRLAYANDAFSDFIPNPALSQNDLPKLPKGDEWTVKFSDKTIHVFTPEKRLISNAMNPVVNAGYDIMKEASRRISVIAEKKHVQVIYTIIPTEENVYSKKVVQEGIESPQSYRDLVENEQNRIRDLAAFFDRLPNSRYVGVFDSLQAAAMGPERIYRFNEPDGHPFPLGYGVIAKALAPAVRELLDGDIFLDPSPK